MPNDACDVRRRPYSSGERRLLLAVYTVCDFGHLADGRARQDITMGCDARYRAAIAACVMEAP
jgi:hypothetical protein